MIVGILLLVVAIINIMEAFRKQKNKLIFRTCNYLVFPVVYLIYLEILTFICMV